MSSRASYGGVEVSLPPIVAIFDADRRRPCFHRYRGSASLERRFATICGLTVMAWDDEGRMLETFGTQVLRLPARHARRFARPCVRCWPELKAATLELEAGRLG